jgi:hypothetical protein
VSPADLHSQLNGCRLSFRPFVSGRATQETQITPAASALKQPGILRGAIYKVPVSVSAPKVQMAFQRKLTEMAMADHPTPSIKYMRRAWQPNGDPAPYLIWAAINVDEHGAALLHACKSIEVRLRNKDFTLTTRVWRDTK